MFKVRKFDLNKRVSARNPITHTKRKYSVKKYTDPKGTIEKRIYNRVYHRTTIDSIGFLQGIVGFIAALIQLPLELVKTIKTYNKVKETYKDARDK